MKITKGIRKSHQYNEDKIIIGNNYFMVCDGATPLCKSNIKPSEAVWFVNYIKNNMPKNCDDVLKQLDKISKDAYNEYSKINIHRMNDVLSYPSCGIAIVEIKNNIAYVYTIGDCEVVIKKKNEKFIRIIQENLVELDNIALNLMKKTSEEKNISLKEAVSECKDILIKHRRMMNQPNGYPAFTISNNPNFEYSVNFFDLEDIKEIYLYSDGITQAFDELKIYNSCEDMFKKSIDVNEEIEKIKERAFMDKDCNKYPRFKTIDDIAIIKIEI